jgi:predicted amidophosphoribosyltransferase
MSDSESKCPACGAPIADTDTFCEACGTALHGDAPPAAPPVDPLIPNQLSKDSTEPPVDDTAPIPRTTVKSAVCAQCGGPILDDGFCGTCGQKARSPRDHWTEQPAPWVGGVCDKGILHTANEDAMALAANPDGSFAVVVVCDGVTSAPHSDRAALAASRAACGYLSAVAMPP